MIGSRRANLGAGSVESRRSKRSLRPLVLLAVLVAALMYAVGTGQATGNNRGLNY